MQNSLEDDVPDIRSKRDLALCEIEDSETGTFLRSTFAYVDKHDTAWFGQTPGIRKFDLTIENIKHILRRVPDEIVYPKATPVITALQKKDLNNYFIKRPKLLCLDNAEETKLLPQMFIDEAEVLELVKKNSHPNLICYYGCTLKDGRVTGIVLEKHQVVLQYRYEDDPRDLDIDACMDGIRAGIRHLHSLGYAHNDLNPLNIGFDQKDNPVIFDLGSCRKFDEQLVSGGTLGWMDEELCGISSRRHDEVAIQKIEAWLKKEKSKRVRERGMLRKVKKNITMVVALVCCKRNGR